MDAFQSIKRNEIKELNLYIKSGGNINIVDNNGMNLLLTAIDFQNNEAVKILLETKIDVNAKDKWGQTPLILAAGRNNEYAVRLLIKSKANLNIVAKNGLTALGYAKDNGFNKVAEIIKKSGGK